MLGQPGVELADVQFRLPPARLEDCRSVSLAALGTIHLFRWASLQGTWRHLVEVFVCVFPMTGNPDYLFNVLIVWWVVLLWNACSHLWLIREYTFPLKKAMMTWWIDVSNSDDTLFFSSMILFVFCPRSLCLPLGFEYGLLWTETKRMCLSQLTFYCFLFPIYVIFSLLFCTFLMSTTKTFYCIS